MRKNSTKLYNLFPKYSYSLTKTNESTVTHLEWDGNNNFLYYFVALGHRGFMQCIRLVIAVDDTYLKKLYNESMFVVTCPDGNYQLYPLAIEILNFENNYVWEGL